MAIFSPFDVPEPKNSEKSPKTTLGIYLEYCALLLLFGKSSVLLYFTLKKVAVLLFHYFSHNLSILFDIF